MFTNYGDERVKLLKKVQTKDQMDRTSVGRRADRGREPWWMLKKITLKQGQILN